MKYYLVEEYNGSLKFEKDAIVVALTPLASYELDKVGINYKIIEDFYNEASFTEKEPAYFNEQLKWFGIFDELLTRAFPEAKKKNLKLATSYFLYIKSMVDSVVVRSKIVESFLKNSDPKSIIYISTKYQKDIINPIYPLPFMSSPGTQSLFSRLIPLFCKKYSIHFERITINGALNSSDTSFGNPNFVKRARDFFTIIFDLNRYKRLIFGNKFLKSTGNLKYNLLFLNSGYNIREIINECEKARCRIFYKERDCIKIKESRYNKLITRIKPDIETIPIINLKEFFKSLYDSEVIFWINNHCGIDVRSIISIKLEYFIYEFCTQFISLINKYIDFYNDHQIDMVFSPHLTMVDEHAAIIAARYSRKTRTAYLQHGDSASNDLWLDFSEYYPKFDIYFTNNSEMEQNVRNAINSNGFKAIVYQNQIRYNAIPKAKNSRYKRGFDNRKKKVVYIPTMYQWDNILWSKLRIPDTWYFMWHKELIKLFSARNDFNFVWKGIPSVNQTYDPIPDMINDKKFINITYADEPFTFWIDKVDIALIDYPTTPLYEAAAGGLPVMCLYFAPYHSVRPSALSLFGRSLQPFYNFSDGLRRVENFLNSDPRDFIVSLSISKASIVQTLPSLIQKQNHNF